MRPVSNTLLHVARQVSGVTMSDRFLPLFTSAGPPGMVQAKELFTHISSHRAEGFEFHFCVQHIRQLLSLQQGSLQDPVTDSDAQTRPEATGHCNQLTLLQ